MSKKSESIHNTAHELAYIDKIGSLLPVGTVHPTKVRSTVLSGYLAAARARKNWGDVDKDAVIAHAEAALRRELGEPETMKEAA